MTQRKSDPNVIEYEPSEEPQDSSISHVLAQCADDDNSNVTVYRTKTPEGKPTAGQQYCYKTHASAFDIDDLRDVYGGGEFRLYITKGGKTFRNIGIAIEPPLKKESDGTHMQSVQNNSSDKFERLMEFMAQDNRQQQNQMMQMMMGIIQSMAGNNNSVNPVEMQSGLMQSMLHMKEILGGGEQVDPTKYLLKGLELAKQFGGEGGANSEESLTGLLKELTTTFGRPLAGYVEQHQQREAQKAEQFAQQQARQQAQRFAQQQVNQNARSNNNEQQTQQGHPNMMQLLIRQQIRELMKHADNGVDPYTLVDDVLDLIPPAFMAQFEEQIRKPTFVSELAKVEPKAVEHAQWLERLRQLLVDELDAPDEPDDTGQQDTSENVKDGTGATDERCHNAETPAHGDSPEST